MPLANTLAIYLHWANRVEGIVHASSGAALVSIDPYAPGTVDDAGRDVRLPMVELVTEGRAVLSLAQLKGLVHDLEAEMMKDTADAQG